MPGEGNITILLNFSCIFITGIHHRHISILVGVTVDLADCILWPYVEFLSGQN